VLKNAKKSVKKFRVKKNNPPVKHILLEIVELANAMSIHFYQRVTVGVLDLGYPSNSVTFGDLFDDSPALLIKHPGKIHQMFYHDEDQTKELHIRHTKLENWGEIIPKSKLSKF